MTKSGASGADTPGSAGKADRRKARLAEELRANLQRRKAQARSRRAGGADERPEGLAASARDRRAQPRTTMSRPKRGQDLTESAACHRLADCLRRNPVP